VIGAGVRDGVIGISIGISIAFLQPAKLKRMIELRQTMNRQFHFTNHSSAALM
jgi:hypothetical protein